MIKKLILVLTSFLLLSNSVFAVEKPQIYMPYPIIFVSGIRTTPTSPSTSWPSTKVFKEFKEYFLLHPENSKESKYEFADIDNLKEGEIPNLEFFFYDSKEAPVDTNAKMLKDEIEKILSVEGGYYKPDTYAYVDPCSTPKVIIIAHSYGGIITRYMLANNIGNIKDKVAAVFFLGTPQLGSPVAVIGYFLPKEIPYLMEDIRNIDDILRKEDFTDRLWDEINFEILRDYERQKVIGNLKFIKWAESEGGLYTSVRDIFDNAAIENAIAGDYQLLALYRKIPPVYQKGVVWATLIPDAQANTYRKKFELHNPANPNKPFVRYIPRDGDLSYDLSKSVLSTLGTDVRVGKVHAIAGTKDDLIREYLCGKAAGYMFRHFDRLDYSCIKNGLWDDGDGVINLASQKAIPGAESNNTHVIDAAHISLLWGLLLTGEADHEATPNIILQAIDDKPVIESVRFVLTGDPEWWRADPDHPGVYIVIKVKDYLLADIEISEYIPLLNLTRGYNDFNEFYDPEAKKYKPYFKFEKDFLKERTDEKAPIFGKGGSISYLHLEPGEFYIKASWLVWYVTQDGGESLRGSIKIKNSAQKETSCEIFYVAPSNGISISKVGVAEGNTKDNPTITYSLVRQAAYSNFLAYQAASSTGPSAPLGFWMGAEGWYYYIFEYVDGEQRRYDYFHADISAGLNSQIGFNRIDIGSNKRVKSVQAYMRIDKSGDLPDCNATISVGDNFSFSLNTADYEYSYFHNYFIIGLDPTIPNTSSTWMINKPDFFEDNYIPVSPELYSSHVYYNRGFSVSPILIIVSEDEEQEEVKQ